jgi:hypothetical protein
VRGGIQLIWLICASVTKKIGWFDAEASWENQRELDARWRFISSSDAHRTKD